jgi:hypothetical protein
MPKIYLVMCQLIYWIYKNLVQRILANNVQKKMRFNGNTLNTVKVDIPRKVYQYFRFETLPGFPTQRLPATAGLL